MDAAHWHLMLNHFPVIGTVFALLLLAVGLVTASPTIRRLSLGAVVFVALVALPAYLTGEPAESAVEGLPGVSETLIERHESVATRSFVAIELAGLVALAGLALSARSRRVPTWVVTGVLLLTSLTAGLMAWTANLGGQIRHTEIRSGVAAPAVDAAPARVTERHGEEGRKGDD
jgi:uncharacterized membrane protein